MRSSFSYWIADVLIDTLAQNCLKFCGRYFDRKTVIFGSGAGHKLYKLCKNLKDVFVTLCLFHLKEPARDSVVHVGSQANISL